jgi:hypothetical protein
LREAAAHSIGGIAVAHEIAHRFLDTREIEAAIMERATGGALPDRLEILDFAIVPLRQSGA